jgi:hypothetical protein
MKRHDRSLYPVRQSHESFINEEAHMGALRGMHRVAVAGLGAIALLAFMALAGCANQESPVQSMGDVGASDFMAESSMSFDGNTKSATVVIRTASISLLTDNASERVEQIRDLTTSFGGSVIQEDLRTSENAEYASMTVKVPNSDLENFIESAKQLGTWTNFSISESDVTMAVTDLDARIEALNTSIEKLMELQRQAASVADLVAVESELASRTAERDSLVAQRAQLQDQVDMSVVYFDIAPESATASSTPDFLGGIASGWQALVNLAAGTVTFIGFLIPLTIALSVGIVIVWLLVRLIKRARQRQ